MFLNDDVAPASVHVNSVWSFFRMIRPLLMGQLVPATNGRGSEGVCY